MAKDYSFDVVCRTDLQEAANAVNQASKEIGTRYDFKGSKSSVSFDGSLITLIGDDDFKLRLVREIVNGKLVKRGISLKNIEEKKKESAAGGTVRQRPHCLPILISPIFFRAKYIRAKRKRYAYRD